MKPVVIVALVTALASCNAYFPHLRVIRANYNVSRGEYQPAVVDYLRARDDSEVEPWLSYNLGNVYHFLGESPAAVEEWEASRDSGVEDLMFGSSFNRGVFLYEQGRFDEAIGEFRFALQIDPGSRAAKNNLELTLEKIAAGSELEGETTAGTSGAGSNQDDDGTTRMLDYVRRKEEQRWRANSGDGVAPDAQDW